MVLSVHQPQYIPWLGYFDKISRSDCFVILDRVQYKAREYQNRNRIRTREGWMWLTVPVKSKGKGRQRICDIEIDNSNGWREKHWNSLKFWYKGAAFFDTYHAIFRDIYAREWEMLDDLNIHIIQHILKELEINTPVYYESDLGITTEKTDRILDICKRLKAEVYLSGNGGRDYLEEYKFAREGIKLEYQHFAHPTYCQQHMGRDHTFLPYMSCIDLLLNEGEQSKCILRGESTCRQCTTV